MGVHIGSIILGNYHGAGMVTLPRVKMELQKGPLERLLYSSKKTVSEP